MSDPKPRRLALWSTGRCLSTAMVMSFGNYGNVEVFNELYAGAAHFGPDRKVEMPMPFPVEEELRFQDIKRMLEADYPTRDLVFMKDHAHSISGMYDQLPSGYSHAFIIRHPAKSTLSNLRLVQKFGLTPEQQKELVEGTGMKGSGFGDLLDLAEHLEGTLSLPVVILDADDLQQDPEVMLRAFCKALGLPFRESLLKWEPITDIPWHNAKSMLTIHKANGAYENALKSTGWIQADPKPLDPASIPPALQCLVDEAMPFYEKLYSKRVRPDNDSSAS